MELVLLAVFLLLIVCGIFIYNYYMGRKVNLDETKRKTGKGLVIQAAIIGGISAFSLMIIFACFTPDRDILPLILASTTILATIICACAGWIVKTIKELK